MTELHRPRDESEGEHLLLLFPHFNTLSESGGIRSWQLAKHLVRLGARVTVTAPAVDLRTQRLFRSTRGKLFHSSECDGAELIRVASIEDFRRSPLHRIVFELIYGALAAIRVLFVRDVDLVVVAYPPALLPVFGLLVGRLKRVPVVFEMRDLMADGLAATGYVGNSALLRMAKTLENAVIRWSDHVIAVSNGIRVDLLDRGVADHKISVVPNGFETEVFAAADWEWDPRDEFGWGDQFVVIYTGALTQSYDIPTLLETASQLQDRDILIVLVGDGDRRQEYEHYVVDRQLKNVQFIDFQPRARIPRILDAADVGVHLFRDDPTWEYVLGNKTFDYMGARLPVIFSGRGDTAELVRESGGGLVVTPETPDELAGAILRLRSDPDEARKMGLNAQDYVRRHYSRPELVEDFYQVVKGLI